MTVNEIVEYVVNNVPNPVYLKGMIESIVGGEPGPVPEEYTIAKITEYNKDENHVTLALLGASTELTSSDNIWVFDFDGTEVVAINKGTIALPNDPSSATDTYDKYIAAETVKIRIIHNTWVSDWFIIDRH